MAKAHIRQRVLGAAVILSLGFIAYSVLIQSNSSAYIDRSAQIPVQTRYIEPLDFDEPKGPAAPKKAEVLQADQMFISETPADLSEIHSVPVLNDAGMPNSWAIKVGSFSTEERANEIRDQLISQGYRSYVRRISNQVANDNLYRISVGPYVDANEVARHQSEINTLLSLETIVLDYEP